jgi:hypothetical protein
MTHETTYDKEIKMSDVNSPKDLRRRGEKHWASKLTWAKVRAMREEAKEPGTSLGYLSKKYGVAISTCVQVLEGRTWKE